VRCCRGFTDFDTILGQLPRFIERPELTQHDIVTYSFGDTEAVYLRGQWTMHRNVPAVNRLWRRCPHLAEGLLQELALKVSRQILRVRARKRIRYSIQIQPVL